MLTAGRVPIASGRTREVVERVRADRKRLRQVVECLWDEEPAVAMRAADALEKLTRQNPRNPDPTVPPLVAALEREWKAPLIGLLAEVTQNKLRWCLAAMIPRMELTLAECERVAGILQSYLDDPSSIVKTCALQGLADLARQDASLAPEVIDLLRIHSRSGTPAMRARGRMLLKQIASTPTKRIFGPFWGESRIGML